MFDFFSYIDEMCNCLPKILCSFDVMVIGFFFRIYNFSLRIYTFIDMTYTTTPILHSKKVIIRLIKYIRNVFYIYLKIKQKIGIIAI